MKFLGFGRSRDELTPQALLESSGRRSRRPRETDGAPHPAHGSPRPRADSQYARLHAQLYEPASVDTWLTTTPGAPVPASADDPALSVSFPQFPNPPERVQRQSLAPHAARPSVPPEASIASPFPAQRAIRQAIRAPIENSTRSVTASPHQQSHRLGHSSIADRTIDIKPAAPPNRLEQAAGRVRHEVDRLRKPSHRYDRMGPDLAAWVRDKGLVEVKEGTAGPEDRVVVKVERGSQRLERLGLAAEFPSLSPAQRMAVVDVLDEGRRNNKTGQPLDLTVAIKDKLIEPRQRRH